ncbi:MAG: hypothetical protein K2J40_03940 [Ruminococcus sp.]|nr:hypothetical protein [Ruminococcus sp.]
MPVVKNYSCENCGAVLGNINSVSGQCEYCGTAFTVESIRNCQEIFSNEGVTSGVPFNAQPQTLYKYVRDFLTSNPAAPSDVLESARITSCKCVCLPAYYYCYTGESAFTCQTANNVKRTVNDSSGNSRTVTDTNWTPFGGNVYATVEGIVSGNSDYDNVIDNMYKDYHINTLVDAESLEIPATIEVVKFTRPANELLGKYIRPNVEESCVRMAKGQLQGMDGYRNLSVIPGKITKERDEKLIMGIYNVNVEYNGNNYPMYISGDGNKVIYQSSSPVDAQKETALNSLKKVLADADSALSSNKTLTTVAFIAAVICFLFMPVALKIIGGIGGIAGGVFLMVKKKPLLQAARDEADNNLNNFNNTQQEVFRSFDANGSIIQGHELLGI